VVALPAGDYPVFAGVAVVHAADPELSARQKREILINWEVEAAHLQESEAEGFDGGEASLLADIKKALIEISD